MQFEGDLESSTYDYSALMRAQQACPAFPRITDNMRLGIIACKYMKFYTTIHTSTAFYLEYRDVL